MVRSLQPEQPKTQLICIKSTQAQLLHTQHSGYAVTRTDVTELYRRTVCQEGGGIQSSLSSLSGWVQGQLRLSMDALGHPPLGYFGKCWTALVLLGGFQPRHPNSSGQQMTEAEGTTYFLGSQGQVLTE